MGKTRKWFSRLPPFKLHKPRSCKLRSPLSRPLLNRRSGSGLLP
jgi:hypothetical protein